MKTNAVFSVVFGFLLLPTRYNRRHFDRQKLRLRGWRMCHKCTWLCCCRRCLQPFSDRTQCLKQTVHRSLVVIKRLPDVTKFLVLRSYYCQDLPCCSSIGMFCDPCRRSSVFRELHFNSSNISSNVHLCIAQELEELHNQQIQSLSTALFVNTEELIIHIKPTRCNSDQ